MTPEEERDWSEHEREWLDLAVKNRHPRVTIALAASYPMFCDPLDRALGTIAGSYLFGNPDLSGVSKN